MSSKNTTVLVLHSRRGQVVIVDSQMDCHIPRVEASSHVHSYSPTPASLHLSVSISWYTHWARFRSIGRVASHIATVLISILANTIVLDTVLKKENGFYILKRSFIVSEHKPAQRELSSVQYDTSRLFSRHRLYLCIFLIFRRFSNHLSLPLRSSIPVRSLNSYSFSKFLIHSLYSLIIL